MTDYKKLYLKLFNASEDAINLLIKAQRECEEIILSSCEQEIFDNKGIINIVDTQSIE